MISIVLYGRNDSYGYNLHKRAALSFNCMAELLTDSDDEILFVDYNTPDDFPTFPEAIQDTLTAKAKARLRILRVRPSVHARFKSKTHLQALEPVARNIAIRRSNPANRWILSTNTDMIFVPRNGQSLSDMVRDLPKGYFGIPRFEIPETLWESLDRFDAAGAIRDVGDWGWKFHLNEIVYGVDTIKFDAPGDFQLIDRDDVHRIHGFNEEMLVGWHVDSNICKRLFMLYGEVGDLSDRLFGYHCDHTRQVTPMHRRTAVENSLARFVGSVSDPMLLEQEKTWGCPDAEIECSSLAAGVSLSYLGGLHAALPQAMEKPTAVAYVRETYDEIGYDPAHVLPYLMDVLSSAPREWSVAWFGIHGGIFDMFRAAWSRMGFTGRINMAPRLAPDAHVADPMIVLHADVDAAISQADVFIFDFLSADGQPLGDARGDAGNALIVELVAALQAVVTNELKRASRSEFAPRRVIAINAIHNRFEPLMRGYIEFARSPFSGRLRHGYVSGSGPASWLNQMTLKVVGERKDGIIEVGPGKKGHVLSGPHVSLLPGRYSILIEIALRRTSVRDYLRILLGLIGTINSDRKVRWEPLPPLSETEVLSKEELLRRKPPQWKKWGAIAVEIRKNLDVVTRRHLSVAQLLGRTRHRFSFSFDAQDFLAPEPPSITLRIWSGGWVPFSIRRVDLVSDGLD